ncbi:hypothetical protein ABPG77_010947 [Micractinium sp. CCAP 211/92]
MSGRGDDRDAGGDGGGASAELAMSIEETNKMRIALGLKPLKMEAEEPQGPSKEALAAKEAAEKEAKAAELAERIKQARERRQKQEELDRTKKLGDGGDDVDDVLAWVSRSRQSQQKKAAEADAAKRRAADVAAARRRGRGSDAEDEDEDLDMPSAAELAGAKVKHTADELAEGETMILTLEDKGILDEKGNLVEEEDLVLENILAREDKERQKARKAAGKQAKPLWEEDGKRRSLLDKYDEEEEQMMQLDDAGAIEAAKQKRQEEIRARLAGAAAATAVVEDASVPVQSVAADYYSAEEMAKFQKPKKKKERKLKKKALTGEELKKEGAVLTAEELAALEAEAVARGGSDLGSRASRAQRAKDKAAAAAAAEAERRQRYEHALNKANYASLALRPEAKPEEELEEAGLDEDEDLYQSLNKARQLAQKKASEEAAKPGPENIAEQLIRRREEQQRAATAAALAGGGVGNAGLVFTDIAEFTRTIAVKQEDAAPSEQQPDGEGGGEGSGVRSMKKEEGPGEEDNYGLGAEAMETDEPAAKGGDNVWAGWVPASGGEGETTAAEMRQKLRAKAGEGGGDNGGAAKRAEAKQQEEESVTRERSIGSGLAGALAFLKDRGELDAPVEWAGRTNERKKVNIQGLDEVYTGGRQEDKLALDVEVALTRKDEYGRILTPKEAFRQLCYRFHGIQPSKNTRERRAKKAAEEIAKKRLASEEGATSNAASLAQMKQVQKQAATPYVVLSGTIKPGQSRDAVSGYATVDRAEQLTAPTPVLGRLPGNEPLTGNAKVEAMLGIKRKGTESMPPPPPKAPRQ